MRIFLADMHTNSIPQFIQLKLFVGCLKVAFFKKVQCIVPISKSPKKIIPKTILNLKLKFPVNNTLLLLAGNSSIKFRIVFWNSFFFKIWRFEKHIALSEKKPPLEIIR